MVGFLIHVDVEVQLFLADPEMRIRKLVLFCTSLIFLFPHCSHLECPNSLDEVVVWCNSPLLGLAYIIKYSKYRKVPSKKLLHAGAGT